MSPQVLQLQLEAPQGSYPATAALLDLVASLLGQDYTSGPMTSLVLWWVPHAVGVLLLPRARGQRAGGSHCQSRACWSAHTDIGRPISMAHDLHARRAVLGVLGGLGGMRFSSARERWLLASKCLEVARLAVTAGAWLLIHGGPPPACTSGLP